MLVYFSIAVTHKVHLPLLCTYTPLFSLKKFTTHGILDPNDREVIVLATDKPRFTITLDPAVLEEVNRFRARQGHRTQSGAIQALILSGVARIREEGLLPETKSAPSLPEEALKAAKDFADLDRAGQRAVRVVLADQKSRVAEERKRRRSLEREGLRQEGPARVIPLYFTPAAAGYASPAFGDDFDYIEVGGEVPAYADFAVKVEGDSMEPYLRDGSTAYVNRDRADADRYIPADSDLRLVCYGRVILPARLSPVVPV